MFGAQTSRASIEDITHDEHAVRDNFGLEMEYLFRSCAHSLISAAWCMHVCATALREANQ
jgi:hypothetical protein